VTGNKNISEGSVPVVFASNHVSIMDSIVILYSLPLRLRKKTAVVMSITHHFAGFFSKNSNIMRRIAEALLFFLLSILVINVIPISRKQGFNQVFKNIGEALDKGWNIILFPEGSVTLDGKIGDFEPGIGIISKDMRTPVVPVRIDGLFNILRNGLLPWGHLPRRPRVVVKFGQRSLLSHGDYKDISKSIEKKVKRL
jgi:long-chain acyl-CoA synthetase